MSDDEDRGRRARERVASLRAMASQRYGDDREFGAERRLKAARLGAGYKTAADAARALGVAEQTYFAHESGRRGLRSDALERYAEGFGVSKEWLLFGEDRPREPAIQAAVREDPTEWQGSPTDIGHPLQAKNRSISGYVYIDYTIHRDPPAWLSLDQIYIPPPEDPMIEYFFICSSLTFEAGRSYIFGDLLGVR
ncbi:MAG: helix-turn-helix transcriptional regulator, partial [Pseudomonadota bacterium]